MSKTSFSKKLHLLSRSGFGISPEQWLKIDSMSLEDTLRSLEKNAQSPLASLSVVNVNVDQSYRESIGLIGALTPEDRRNINRENVAKVRDLTIAWMNSMLIDDNQLREKIALFWHGHFACRLDNAYFQQQMLDVIRKNALGNFADLLEGTSKCAAMLSFLNNQQNKKAHPNENFAREVMELFTLGRGHYTESDIKEAARAFTGWSYNAKGEFTNNTKVHDDGTKTILGKTGNFTGDDVLKILLENKQTAQYISLKMYKYLVNDIPNEKHVNWLADRFYQSNYNIGSLVHDIFTAGWFYQKENMGAIIKSPVDLLVNIQRTLPMKIENPDRLLIFNDALGQKPFYPPNVAGWPGGTSWIDSSSLMLRLKIPQLIEENKAIHITTKVDDDVQMGRKMMNADSVNSSNSMMAMDMQSSKPVPKKNSNKIEASIEWDSLLKVLEPVKDQDLFATVSQIVLGASSDKFEQTIIEKKVPLNPDRKVYVKNLMLAMMSTPEFQLS
ncbi:MAG: DUF1800 domain-containing protein [Pseudopedobacter saltans]|uniref:DUF1800 domain-containing protein n=1 Tax=Pseudopedobacter saltans TaxID=151895 RepID=A0A2W5F968_9SPHI|nr:MAG: DUF1800 domain-containing protein [Pseudopedobacter saltans]